ncbi:MAG: sporulation protein [Lachnospiraceae bacterium]|nr:sporulation protein [Lachnospiraceae bacterium]
MSDISQFANIVESLFTGMNAVASSKTVVGDPIVMGDTTILPLTEITFGIGAGNGKAEKQASGKGAIGGKISPVAVLVVRPDSVRLVSIKNQDSISKVLDMVPDVLDRFSLGKKDPEEGPNGKEALEAAFPEGGESKSFKGKMV